MQIKRAFLSKSTTGLIGQPTRAIPTSELVSESTPGMEPTAFVPVIDTGWRKGYSLEEIGVAVGFDGSVGMKFVEKLFRCRAKLGQQAEGGVV